MHCEKRSCRYINWLLVREKNCCSNQDNMNRKKWSPICSCQKYTLWYALLKCLVKWGKIYFEGLVLLTANVSRVTQRTFEKGWAIVQKCKLCMHAFQSSRLAIAKWFHVQSIQIYTLWPGMNKIALDFEELFVFYHKAMKAWVDTF